jgi:hypothetical protein
MRIAYSPLLLACLVGSAAGAEGPPVSFTSPGFPASQMDEAGRLLEDWGAFQVRLAGEGIVDAATQVTAVKLQDLVPAAQAVAERGAIRLRTTTYRAPTFPAGVDVVTVRLEEVRGQAAQVTLAVELPDKSQLGVRTVKLGGRTVLTLPRETLTHQELRDWGYCDEATSLPRWAKPQGECDPAFRNIRAGMGGVPIAYRFRVQPKSRAHVVLGFCESHWSAPGQRPLSCRVEGVVPQIVDPVGKWGQHQPGALAFAARDENGDGLLEIGVRPAAGAADRNPILNVIWIFPSREPPALEQVIAGKFNSAATYYVDVGGENDQSLFPAGKLEYHVALPAGNTREFVFLAACNGGNAPVAELGVWGADTLLKSACDVWRDWPTERKP